MMDMPISNEEWAANRANEIRMPNTPTLNERAAQLAKLTIERDQHGAEYYHHPTTGLLICLTGRWNPAGKPGLGWQAEQGDYNHAHLIYDRVVEMGLEDEVRIKLAIIAADTFAAGFRAGLNLTAAQLTEACCEVIEEHERSKR